MYETLKVELEGAVAILTLKVPEKLNTHTKKMSRELFHFWRETEQFGDHDGGRKGILFRVEHRRNGR
jgi:enoyl-CoA hydratase/carnithine racemase